MKAKEYVKKLRRTMEQCRKKSISDVVSYIELACTADCDCERIKKYDKLKKGE